MGFRRRDETGGTAWSLSADVDVQSRRPDTTRLNERQRSSSAVGFCEMLLSPKLAVGEPMARRNLPALTCARSNQYCAIRSIPLVCNMSKPPFCDEIQKFFLNAESTPSRTFPDRPCRCCQAANRRPRCQKRCNKKFKKPLFHRCFLLL